MLTKSELLEQIEKELDIMPGDTLYEVRYTEEQGYYVEEEQVVYVDTCFTQSTSQISLNINRRGSLVKVPITYLGFSLFRTPEEAEERAIQYQKRFEESKKAEQEKVNKMVKKLPKKEVFKAAIECLIDGTGNCGNCPLMHEHGDCKTILKTALQHYIEEER